MLQAAQVKHPDTSVRAAADEDVHTVCTKSDIVYLLVVRDELSLGCQGRDVPNGAGGVDARGDDETWGDGIPVQ